MKRQHFWAIVTIALGGLCFPGNLQAQQSFECPYKIGYSTTYPCTGVPQPGFYIHFNNPYTGSTAVQFNFDPSGPNCQSMGLSHGPSNCGNYWLTDITDPCTLEMPTGTLTFTINGIERECHYKDGLLDYELSTGCDDLVADCGESLAEFARDFIPTDENCKLWEGSCAPESEIWRTGTVILGADRLSGNFKLGVKGGITTEMLQICKTEWCDYVFDDTFRLKPLIEITAFIRANGHLPGCTPGAKINAEGSFYLDEEAVHQQEKIEEIFLYLIALQKRLDHVENKIKASDWIDNPLNQKPAEKNSSPNISHAFVVPGSEMSPKVTAQITCFQIQPGQPGVPNGVGGVSITPAGGPYNLSWSGPGSGQMTGVDCAGAIKIPGLLPGSYTVTVSDNIGLIGTCVFSVGSSQGSCADFNNPDCKKDIIDFLEQQAFNLPPACEQWDGDPCSHTENIYRLGNVGIGTNVLKPGYSLAVKGGIGTDKFRVELCETSGWCDYVFDKDYILPILSDVESYIKANQHLPGMITQSKIIQDGGFELRQVKLDQQEKIEEAFLYLIQLNNKKKELNEKLSQLHKQLK